MNQEENTSRNKPKQVREEEVMSIVLSFLETSSLGSKCSNHKEGSVFYKTIHVCLLLQDCMVHGVKFSKQVEDMLLVDGQEWSQLHCSAPDTIIVTLIDTQLHVYGIHGMVKGR